MMSNYALRIPDSLFEYAKRLAEEESVSMNQFFVMAIGRRYRPSRRRNSFKSTRSPRT
jgi:predicted HicB family RNase H-like nuclease